MQKVHIFENTNIAKVNEEIIGQFDIDACKSWFTLDIKLGLLSFKFNQDIFANRGEFDLKYFEKIRDFTKEFTDFSKESLAFCKKLSLMSMSQDKLSKTINVGPRATNLDKKTSIGYQFLHDVLLTLSSSGDNSNKANEMKTFLESNFFNYKRFLSSKLKMRSTIDQFDLNRIDKDEISKNYFLIDIICARNGKVSYLYVPINPSGFNNTSKDEKILNYQLLPLFVRDLIPQTFFNQNLSNISFKTDTNQAKNGIKFDVILSNKYNDFKKNSNVDKSANIEDEIEASYDVLISKLKDWIVDKYLSKDAFITKIQSEMKTFSITDSLLVSHHINYDFRLRR